MALVFGSLNYYRKRYPLVAVGILNGSRAKVLVRGIMVGVVGALSAFYEDTLDIENEEHRIHACYRMVAKMPTIAAMALKYSIGQPFIYPKNQMTYS